MHQRRHPRRPQIDVMSAVALSTGRAVTGGSVRLSVRRSVVPSIREVRAVVEAHGGPTGGVPVCVETDAPAASFAVWTRFLRSCNATPGREGRVLPSPPCCPRPLARLPLSRCPNGTERNGMTPLMTRLRYVAAALRLLAASQTYNL